MRNVILPLYLLAAMPVLALPQDWTAQEGAVWADGKVSFEPKKNGSVSLKIAPDSDQTLILRLVEKGRPGFWELNDGQEEKRYSIARDKVGDALTIGIMEKNPENGRWAIPRRLASGRRAPRQSVVYRPGEKVKAAWDTLAEAKLSPSSWRDRDLALRLFRRGNEVLIYLDGMLVGQETLKGNDITFSIGLSEGDTVAPGAVEKLAVPAQFQPLILKHLVEGAPAGEKLQQVKGIPFLRPDGAKGIDLRKANWPFAATMPSNYYAAFNCGPMYLNDPRLPSAWAPVADYQTLHLLVRRTPDADKLAKRFSVRIGSFGHGGMSGRGQVLQHDYHVEIPAGKDEALVAVPLTHQLAQDLSGTFDIGFNREMKLARRRPDPSRFEIRPIGLPPGVEILAATLERAPLEWEVHPKEAGGVFVGKKEAVYEARLRNPSDKPVSYTIETVSRFANGGVETATQTGKLAAGEEKKVPVTIQSPRWGYHELQVKLIVGDSTRIRQTSFALLPPDERKHRSTTPFGTWTFNGGHMTCDDPDILGTLLVKAGLRFGMATFVEAREKYGILNNFEAKAFTKPEQYLAWKEKNPGGLEVALLMHEHSISGDHVSRVPDIFSGRNYKLSPKEEERFKGLWDTQIQMAEMMRKNFPEVHMRLGNGPLPTKEIFLQRKFPAELFDSLGNEAGSFGRLPEAQPPDFVANNASLWMDHELLKAFGYDKTVTQCYEITYPSTNPGNLDPYDQAAYFVRHAVHSMSWNIAEIRFGCLDDCGSAYRYSNWGASGFMYAWPHLNPKPAYVAIATMTSLLDGASFSKELPAGSDTAYAVELNRKDKQNVYVLWTIRGERDYTAKLTGLDWKVVDWEGNAQPVSGAEAKLVASPMPIFLIGKGSVTELTSSQPRYAEAPAETAKLVTKLDTLDAWEPDHKADPVLDGHNPLTPRRVGKFSYKVAEGETPAAVEVTADLSVEGLPTVPMYGILKAKQAIELPGEPGTIGLWVKGNSGWGRVIYELEDASGQKWTSIGAARSGEISEWMLDWLPAEYAQSKDEKITQADWNTNDVFGLSSINFDGWRYVKFPLPGNYEGEPRAPWPANSQWRATGDGVVKYPLKLTRVIFEASAKRLKLTDYTEVKNPTIAVRDLHVEEGKEGYVPDRVTEEVYLYR